MPSALRPGQKVMLTGEVLYCLRPGIDVALDCGDDDRWIAYNVPASALTPVVEPEPQWVPGDVVRYDGENYMLRDDEVWIPCNCDLDWLSLETMSERWAESRVEVVYKAGSDE